MSEIIPLIVPSCSAKTIRRCRYPSALSIPVIDNNEQRMGTTKTYPDNDMKKRNSVCFNRLPGDCENSEISYSVRNPMNVSPTKRR